MKTKPLAAWLLVSSFALTCGLILAPRFSGVIAQESDPPCLAASSIPDPEAPVIDCPSPPNTFDVSGFFGSDATDSVKAQAGPTYDVWAWATFAALNWPVKHDPSQPTGYVRGVPDLESSLASAKPGDELVWETFKEKRELFQPIHTPAGSKVTARSKWQDLTFDPRQQPHSSSNQHGIIACPAPEGSSAAAPGAAGKPHRLFMQGAKAPQTGDEIIEVASPPREPGEQLCAGYSATSTPTAAQCLELFQDADPEARPPVGPRVWHGDPRQSTARPLYFEVKVNYDFWKYILQQGYQLDTPAQHAANSPLREEHPKLPFRTSSSKGPGRSTNAVYAYDAAKVASSYRDLADPNVLPGIGSVQLKAAWLKLTKEEVRSESYHVTPGVFYRTIDPDKPGGLKNTCYESATFGLLALHIIQRVHSRPFERRSPGDFAAGGTFVFATWEHVGLGEFERPSDYFYANYLTADNSVVTDYELTPFPNFSQAGAINVVRMHDYPLPTTKAVNDAVHAKLPRGSIWRKYRLIGTQFLPVNHEKEALKYNQPYYLANLVVETNKGLQNFRGLPPKVTVTPYYTSKVSIQGTTTKFAPDQPNVIFNRELKDPINMGGCMGCHGVAQLKGFNFSFVFADGQEGSGLDTQRHFDVAGAAAPPEP